MRYSRHIRDIIVTVHWVDVSYMTINSLLLTIIEVACGTGVGRRVDTALL
jgi:hypothetical protein